MPDLSRKCIYSVRLLLLIITNVVVCLFISLFLLSIQGKTLNCMIFVFLYFGVYCCNTAVF